MNYSNVTLESVVTKFELEKTESIGIFSEIEPITPSDYLTTGLAKKVPLHNVSIRKKGTTSPVYMVPRQQESIGNSSN